MFSNEYYLVKNSTYHMQLLYIKYNLQRAHITNTYNKKTLLMLKDFIKTEKQHYAKQI